MIEVDTYAPILVPINWQSERVYDRSERITIINRLMSQISHVLVDSDEWGVGYGSLEHDNLPLMYQPSVILRLAELEAEDDLSNAKLYIYDNCIAVLHLRILVNSGIEGINDLAITNRVEGVSKKHIAPILSEIYELRVNYPLIQPSKYRFFNFDKESLTSARPFWVARMITKKEKLPISMYMDWLVKVDQESAYLLLGSGNSLMTDLEFREDVHRIMVLSQFHSALMVSVETLLKEGLNKFNSEYYRSRNSSSLDSSLKEVQYKNDHIEFVNIQMSSVVSGVQGRRREILKQFVNAWEFSAQRERIQSLIDLNQNRIDRLLQRKLRNQNRSIQTLLAFLGSLSLVSLMVDLIDLNNDIEHDSTVGLLDFIGSIPAENLLGLSGLIVVFLTLYFYLNHE